MGATHGDVCMCRTHTQERTRIVAHRHVSNIHMRTCTQTQSNTGICTHPREAYNSHTHMCMHRNIHTCTCTYRHHMTCTSTYTYTHVIPTCILSDRRCCLLWTCKIGILHRLDEGSETCRRGCMLACMHMTPCMHMTHTVCAAWTVASMMHLLIYSACVAIPSLTSFTHRRRIA